MSLVALGTLFSTLLARLTVGLLFTIALAYDLLTLPLYTLLYKPWIRYSLMNRQRSVRTHTSYKHQSITYDSVRTMPEHYLLDTPTIDTALEEAHRRFANRECVAYREVISTIPAVHEGKAILKYELSDYNWLTFGDVHRQIVAFRGHLSAIGVQQGDMVMIYADTSHKWLISALGIITNGSILVTLYTSLSDSAIIHGIEQIKVRHIVTTKTLFRKLQRLENNLPSLENVILLDGNFTKKFHSNGNSNGSLNGNSNGKLNGNSHLKHNGNSVKISNGTSNGHSNGKSNGTNGHTKTKLNGNSTGNSDDKISEKFGDRSLSVISFDSIISSSFETISPTKIVIQPDDLAIIMYTSGTGGIPKGVRITHRNFIEGMRANLSQIGFFLPQIEDHTIIAYLPLAHILEIITECFLLFVGARLGFSSPSTITDISPGLQEGTKGDASLLRPTLMTAVPLVLERIRKGILCKLQKKGIFAVKALEFLINYKSFWMSKGFETPLLNNLIFAQFAKVVGGRLQILMVGGAPIPPKTQEFTRNVLNVILSQGYGSTETVGNGMFTDEYDASLGKVGGPLCGLKVKLVSWNEGGYCVTDKPNPRGEIHFLSPSVAAGYYQLDSLCESSFYFDEEDGTGSGRRRWFRTGDIAEVLPNGCFKIIDRKKDFIKFAFGEYVSLGKIESKLKSSYLVNNVCIVAQPQQNRVVALVIPNLKVIAKFGRSLSLAPSHSPSDSLTPEESNRWLCHNDQIRALVLRKLRHFGRNCGLKNCELPSDLLLLDGDWTPETGLVTASFKIKRKAIENHYAKELATILIDGQE